MIHSPPVTIEIREVRKLELAGHVFATEQNRVGHADVRVEEVNLVEAMGLFTEDALGLPFNGLDLLLVALDEVLARGLPLVHFQACGAEIEGDIIDTDDASEGVDVDDILIRIAVDALHVPRVGDASFGVEDLLSGQGALDADGNVHTTQEDMSRGVQDVFDRIKLSSAKVGWEGVGLNKGMDGATELDLFACDGVVDASSVLAVDKLGQ